MKALGLRMYDVTKEEERFNFIAKNYIETKASISALENELEKMKSQLDEILLNNKTFESDLFCVIKSKQSRDVFNLKNALNQIGHKILTPFISQTEYFVYRVKEKSVTSLSKAS